MKLDRKLILFIGLFIGLFFIERPTAWLCDPDETRYAQIPQSMLASGDFVTPRLNGSHYFEKPPLFYWCEALAMKLGGESPYVARLPSRVAILGIVALLLIFLRNTAGSVNLWAGIIFISSALPFVLGRVNIIDGLVSFGITLTLLSMRDILMSSDSENAPASRFAGVGIGAAIGVMSKGLIGLVLPGMVFFMWCLINGNWKSVRQILLSRGTLLFFIITVPWFILMNDRHAGFLYYFFIKEHVLRYATHEAHRSGPIYYFIPVVIAGLLPWTYYAARDLRRLFKSPIRLQSHRDETFFGLWFGLIFIFFSISKSKLIPYILPALPAAAALIAMQMEKNKPPMIFKILGVWAGVLTVLIYLQPRISERRSLHDLAMIAAQSPMEQTVMLHMFSPELPRVFKRPVPVVGFQGELASDGIKDPQLFWSDEQFWSQWNSEQPTIALARRDVIEQPWFSGATHSYNVIAGNKRYVLLSNQRSSTMSH